MSLNFKNIIGASLLTIAVLGGTATYLGNSLTSAPAHHVLVGEVTELSPAGARHADVVVTEGRAS
jgi:hypothetical protein